MILSTTVTLQLDEAHAERLQALAADMQVDQGAVVAALIDQYGLAPTPFTAEQEAALRAGLADAEAGRLADQDAVFARLEAKYGA